MAAKEIKVYHEHQWGPVEESRITGTPHRKCLVTGCKQITLDLIDEDYLQDILEYERERNED